MEIELNGRKLSPVQEFELVRALLARREFYVNARLSVYELGGDDLDVSFANRTILREDVVTSLLASLGYNRLGEPLEGLED